MEVIPNHWTKSSDDPPSTDRLTFQNRSPWGMAQSCLLFGWLLPVRLSYSNWRSTNKSTNNFGGPVSPLLPAPQKKGSWTFRMIGVEVTTRIIAISVIRGPYSFFTFLCCWNGDQPKLWWFHCCRDLFAPWCFQTIDLSVHAWNFKQIE